MRHVCDIITVRHNKGERDREAFFLYDGNSWKATYPHFVAGIIYSDVLNIIIRRVEVN